MVLGYKLWMPVTVELPIFPSGSPIPAYEGRRGESSEQGLSYILRVAHYLTRHLGSSMPYDTANFTNARRRWFFTNLVDNP